MLSLNPDGKTTRMELTGGVEYSDQPDQAGRVLRFQHIGAARALGVAPQLKARGGDAKELTIFEIIHEMRSHDKMIPMRSLQAELFERLARAFAMPLLPLMAMPTLSTTMASAPSPAMMMGSMFMTNAAPG